MASRQPTLQYYVDAIIAFQELGTLCQKPPNTVLPMRGPNCYPEDGTASISLASSGAATNLKVESPHKS